MVNLGNTKTLIFHTSAHTPQLYLHLLGRKLNLRVTFTSMRGHFSMAQSSKEDELARDLQLYPC